ncbi:MAG: hypothetical protein M1838_003588 [Thelocarpon superellum]|nr:MAG: hypothetical protein M1838_003588 [Thelocarpon superellum]
MPPIISAADALQRKHEAEAAHRATVEDDIDEEDIAHPPPSANPTAAHHLDTAIDPAVGYMSAKAAGKQKAADEPALDEMRAPLTQAQLNTQSHELFPQLGAGPPARKPRPVAAAWGAKKVNGVAAAGANGHSHPASSTTSSRASTPASGPATPGSASASHSLASHANSQRGPVPQQLSIPGRYSERITLYPQEMTPRAQLKKPVPDVLREINKRSKAKVQMFSGAGGAVQFEATGPVEPVRQALKEVAKELGSKQSTKVTVPASVRPHIIGRQGATIQGISQRTGARIQVPRPENVSSLPADEDDDAGAIEVLIEGDSVAAEMARREIEAIVSERTSNVNIRMKGIPAEYYAFLAGPHNSRLAMLEDGRDVRVHIPHHHTWTVEPPQLSSPNERPIFAAATTNPIRVSGERLAVQEVCAEIERQVQHLRENITLSQLDINRGQHQFVIGEKGTSLHDFLAQTGCTVLLPPDAHDTETLTILGPREQIDLGLNKVMDLATSMQMAHVDIARQHPHAPLGPAAHARSLTRYLQHRKEIERLERAYDAHIALPGADGPSTAWEIYSRDGKNNIRARSEIINIINGHPPARLAHVDVDPFYQAHVRDQSAQRLQKDHGVALILPDTPDEDQVLLVFEGPAALGDVYELPKKAPSAGEVQEGQRALVEAQAILQALIREQEPVVSRTIDIPKRFQEKVQKHVNRERLRLSSGSLPVRVQIGASMTTKGQPGGLPPGSGPVGVIPVFMQGPVDGVNAVTESIEQFVVAETEYEREKDYVTVFDFPQKFANYLIGKKGENIRKYREEFDVEIQVNDGKVEIKGPKVKAESAKSRIAALGRKLEDETTHVLKIKPQYHRDLIGAKGSQVNRLQDRYHVRVNFPRAAPTGAANDDRSVGDQASDVGAGPRYGRPPQAPDEVVVRGPRKGADEAREELLNLLQWTIDHSCTASVSVARNQIPLLIGQGGREMESLRMTTGAQIDVPDGKRDGGAASGRAEIRLKGTKKEVDEAKRILEQRAKTFDETIVRTLEVDKSHHKALIGGGGANLRDIVIKAGGPDDRRELARTVRFPRQDSDETSIKVEGPREVVEKIIAAMELIIQQRENQVTDLVEVAAEKHRMLIGHGGETRRKLEAQFHIGLEIPKQTASAEARGSVKVTGTPADVAKAKAHILSLTQEAHGQSVEVPRRLHHVIADNGQFFRRLRNEHKVFVDHAGQTPPPRKATGPAVRARANGSALPLITDEPAGAERFSWELVDESASGAEEGSIPWVLRGSPEHVGKAQSLLEAALAEAAQQLSTGYLILPDPSTYRYVIGPGGSQVNAIRKRTGCKINVPRDQAKGEAVVISGSKDGVETAKDMILDAVRAGSSSGDTARRGSRG